MRFNHLIPALVIGLLFITGCDQDPNTATIPDEPNEQLAWAMANALADDQIREDVHTAMDHSPYVEHKLVLGEFLDSDQGSRLKAGLETQLGSADKLEQLLDELPDMDFYLPYETHRKIWEHTKDDYMVVCVMKTDAQKATAFHPSGVSQLLSSHQQIHEAEISALFSLHPSEPKIIRSEISTNKDKYSHNQSGDVAMMEVYNFISEGPFSGYCEFLITRKNKNVLYFHVKAYGKKPIWDPHTGEVDRWHMAPGFKEFFPPMTITAESASKSNPVVYEIMEIDNVHEFTGDKIPDHRNTFSVTESDNYRVEMGSEAVKIKIKVY